ncbi:MAG: YfhO family protein, partial [Patescibacteria group bacterium]
WTVLIVLQPLLAAVFLYLYLRSNNLSPLTCLFGAVTWAFSGFMLAWLTWGTIVHVVLWLPLILMSVDKLNKNRLFWSAILVIALVCQFFGGHAQVSLYVVLLSGLYAIWRRAIFFWILLAISIVLSSVQWVPLIGSLLESSRLSNVNVWQTPGWFLPWQHIAQFFAPDFFGNPATLNYWGEWNYGEFIGYISIVGIIFAIYALLLAKKSASVKFWGAIVGVTFLFLPPTPLAKLPHILEIPILSSLQPTRIMVIVDFALVILAALGFEQWQKNRDRRIWFAVGTTGVILLMLWAITPSLAAENVEVARRNLILPSILVGLTSFVIALVSVSRKKIIMIGAA